MQKSEPYYCCCCCMETKYVNNFTLMKTTTKVRDQNIQDWDVNTSALFWRCGCKLRHGGNRRK